MKHHITKIIIRFCTILIAVLALSAIGPETGIHASAMSTTKDSMTLGDLVKAPTDPPGYCDSTGGSTLYEHLTDVKLTYPTHGTVRMLLPIYISNPTGCTSGSPCPEYDANPEYANAWIDWDSDHSWETPAEKAIDDTLTGYLAINYHGRMIAAGESSTTHLGPSAPTWLRANLGWGHDPNDPCEATWTWGNVINKAVHFTSPTIVDITAQGVGTANSQPETGSRVRLEAVLDVPAGYEITSCSWTGDLTPGAGDTANHCRYEYTPAIGPGPSVSTYGTKDVTLTINFRHVATDIPGTRSSSESYKVFFRKAGDDDGDSIPNWLEYWADDGAVAGLGAADIRYDPSCPAGYICYGGWSSSTNLITLQTSAADTHYGTGLTIPHATHCPGDTFGGVRGIDSVAEVLRHERNHQTIYHNWDATNTSSCGVKAGPWGSCTDSDTSPVHHRPGDDLPNTYEGVLGTDPNTVDSCDLATYKGSMYADYGDNEYDCLVASDGATGVAANDWANPGKQTTPPFEMETTPLVRPGQPEGNSGPAGALAQKILIPNRVYDNLGSLTGVYSDLGVDTDSDGLYNYLSVSVGVKIETATQYYVIGWLEDSQKNEIGWASAGVPAGTGEFTIDLPFDGILVRQSGLNGPYKLSRVELRLAEINDLVDAADYPYTTEQYSITEFDLPEVSFTSKFGDQGEDLNQDGLYDRLHVIVEVDVQHAGTYTLAGQIEGSGVIAVASTKTPLSVGNQQVDLYFDGFTIYQSRIDGPYGLVDLRLEDSNGQVIDFIAQAYHTSVYTYGQFQHRETTIIANTYKDEGFDPNSDSDFEYLHVEFQVNTVKAGAFRLLATLRDPQGEDITSLDIPIDLSGQENTVVLDFPGGPIFLHGVDGPYEIASLALLSEDGVLLDFIHSAHQTQFYYFSDFSPPLVKLSGNYQDYGLDRDGDGLFGALGVDIEVTPGDSGVIFAIARLVVPDGANIAWAKNYTYLKAGQTGKITLFFNGADILTQQKNGPYQLRDLFVYHSGDPEQGLYIDFPLNTQPYSLSDFEPFDNYFNIILPLILRLK